MEQLKNVDIEADRLIHGLYSLIFTAYCLSKIIIAWKTIGRFD